jgi:non-ribosomal peptide synthetase component F
VLKTGNAYVPLETWHAPAYVAAIVAEACAALIVADEAGAALAAAASPATPLLKLADADAHPAQDPGHDVSPDALACVYYTSERRAGPRVSPTRIATSCTT